MTSPKPMDILTVSPYLRTAIEWWRNGNDKSCMRLVELTDHWCRVYGVDPTPYIAEAKEYWEQAWDGGLNQHGIQP